MNSQFKFLTIVFCILSVLPAEARNGRIRSFLFGKHFVQRQRFVQPQRFVQARPFISSQTPVRPAIPDNSKALPINVIENTNNKLFTNGQVLFYHEGHEYKQIFITSDGDFVVQGTKEPVPIEIRDLILGLYRKSIGMHLETAEIDSQKLTEKYKGAAHLVQKALDRRKEQVLASRKPEIRGIVKSAEPETRFVSEPDEKKLAETSSDSENDFSKYPKQIQDFIALYKKINPHMKFDPRLAAFATKRSKTVLTKGGSHPKAFVNGVYRDVLNYELKQFGYPLPPGTADYANEFESLWGGTNMTAQQALDGWKSSPHHYVHVYGVTQPFKSYTRYGIGMYNVGGVIQYTFISTPEPPAQSTQ